MDLSSKLPKIRELISIEKISEGGQEIIVLADATGTTEACGYFPIEALELLRCFDGESRVADVLQTFNIEFEQFSQLKNTLADALLLETPEVLAKLKAIRGEFVNTAIRDSALAGRVYPDDPQELKTALTNFKAGVDLSKFKLAPRAKRISMVANPHIDYRRGQATYAVGLEVLERIEPPDVVFLIGTAHKASSSLFPLTAKPHQTPLGLVQVEQQVVSSISRAYGIDRSFADEHLHRFEHSLELQLPLLQHAYAKNPFTIVPILVSSFHQYLSTSKLPIEFLEVSDFVDAIVEQVERLEKSGKKVMFYLGVDFSHMGRAFGDSGELDVRKREEIASRDRILIQAVSKASSRELFEHIQEDLDSRRVCGFPSTYLALSVYERLGRRLKGVLADYRQSYDENSDCLVSFASIYWEDSDTSTL